MSENLGSLRSYFMIAGCLGGGFGVYGFLSAPTLGAAIVAVLGIALAAVYLYLGIRLKTLLLHSPKTALRLVLSGAFIIGASILVRVFLGPPGLLSGFIGLAIVGYLYRNMRYVALDPESVAEHAAVTGPIPANRMPVYAALLAFVALALIATLVMTGQP